MSSLNKDINLNPNVSLELSKRQLKLSSKIDDLNKSLLPLNFSYSYATSLNFEHF